MSQAEIFQEAIELRAKLAASEAHIATLRAALMRMDSWFASTCSHEEYDTDCGFCAERIACCGALSATPEQSIARIVDPLVQITGGPR